MSVCGAAVIRSHQDVGGFARRKCIQHIQHLSNVAIGSFNRPVILRTVPAVRMALVIDIIQVDEGERRAVLPPVSDGRRGGLGWAALMLQQIGSFFLQQVGKTAPIVEHGNLAGWVGRAQNAEYGGEFAVRGPADRLEFHHMAQPAVRGDAVLGGRGAVDGRSPVRTAECRQDAAGFQSPRPAVHQFAHARHARFSHAIDAQSVHTNDDDARAGPGACRFSAEKVNAAQRQNNRQQACFGAHTIIDRPELLR